MMKRLFSMVLLMAASCLIVNAQDEIVPGPSIYIVGDAAPNGWSISNPTVLTKQDDGTWVYKGKLIGGKQFKFYTKKGSWDNPAIRATTADAPLTKDGFASQDFTYNSGEDNKWKVTDGGYYKLTLDLTKYTISAEYLGDTFQSMLPLGDIYAIGWAVSKSWNISDRKKLTNLGNNVYQYKGLLYGGDGGYQFRFITNTDDLDALSLKPANRDAKVSLSATGFAEDGVEYRQDPDINWWVEHEGYYTITLDLNNLTVRAAQYYDIEIGSTGYATAYYGNQALTVPTGVTASTYAVVDGKLTATKTYASGEVIPKGTGVVLKGTANTTYTFDVSSETGEVPSLNQLYGSDENAETSVSGATHYYMLSLDSEGKNAGFYWGADNGAAFTNGAHKAYLALNSTATANVKAFLFDGGTVTTGISTINAKACDAKKHVYTLSGMRMGSKKLPAGVYIRNGRKFVVK